MAGGHEGPLQTSKCHKHANSISHWGTEKCDGIKWMGDDQKMANSRGISMLFYDRNETQKYIVVVVAIQLYYYFEGRAIMCKRRASNG